MSLPTTKVPETDEPRTGFYCDECRDQAPVAHKHESAWHYPASGGGFYEIIRSFGDNYSCSCPGFHFRGRCRHLYGEAGVYALEMQAAQEATTKPQKPKVKLEELFTN